MRKLISLFALLIMISFATGWTASQPPGIETETEYTISADMDILVPVLEVEQSMVYLPVILPHNPGDIQSREALNQIKDTYQVYIYFMNSGEQMLFCRDYANYSQSPNISNNTQRSFAKITGSQRGLYRLDIGEYLCVFKT